MFGHQSVFVLDGGLPAWQRAGGNLETSPPKNYPAATYPVPAKNEDLVRSFEEVSDLAKRRDQGVQILDARSSGRYPALVSLSYVRFHGSDPEPREGGSMESCQLIFRPLVWTYPWIHLNALSEGN